MMCLNGFNNTIYANNHTVLPMCSHPVEGLGGHTTARSLLLQNVTTPSPPPSHTTPHALILRTFTGTMASLTEGKMDFVTKLSSAGLVYLHFGERVIAEVCLFNV